MPFLPGPVVQSVVSQIADQGVMSLDPAQRSIVMRICVASKPFKKISPTPKLSLMAVFFQIL